MAVTCEKLRLVKILCRASLLVWLLFLFWGGSYICLRLITEIRLARTPLNPPGTGVYLQYGIGLGASEPPSGARYSVFVLREYSPVLTYFYLPMFELEHIGLACRYASLRSASQYLKVRHLVLAAVLGLGLFFPLMFWKGGNAQRE